jgi:hypothetical protein
MLTNVRGGNEFSFVVQMFENSGQDLWWKPVDGDICVPDRPYYLQNPTEIPFDAKYL